MTAMLLYKTNRQNKQESFVTEIITRIITCTPLDNTEMASITLFQSHLFAKIMTT